MKKLFSSFLVFIVAILLAACGNQTNTTEKASKESDEQKTSQTKGSSEEKYELTLSHGFPATTDMQKFMEWYNEELKKRSDGRLSLKIFPEGQILKHDQEVAGLLQGQVDMVHTTNNILSSFDPIWNFYDLPFLFNYDPKDPMVYLEHKEKFMHHKNGGEKMAKRLEEKGIKVLGVGYIDIYGSIFTNGKLLTSAESFKGIKVRTQGGIIAPKTIEVLGGSSVTIPGTEAITALQTGVVDGMLTVPMYAYDTKLPVKTYTVIPTHNTAIPILISLKKFESLPKDLQEIMEETGRDYEKYVKETVAKAAKEKIEKLKTEMNVEFYYPTEEELKEFKEITKPVWDFFAEEVEGGGELLEVLSTIE
jgi:TRAP-type C4-dicarboxylate transport system substrate-binding protein